MSSANLSFCKCRQWQLVKTSGLRGSGGHAGAREAPVSCWPVENLFFRDTAWAGRCRHLDLWSRRVLFGDQKAVSAPLGGKLPVSSEGSQ